MLKCERGCAITETERVMAEAEGLDPVYVHAFMCTWEKYVEQVLDGRENDVTPTSFPVYVVMGSGGILESVWTTPGAAIDAKEGLKSPTAFVAVRPSDRLAPTKESREALNYLRKLEADRHNDRVKRIREGGR